MNAAAPAGRVLEGYIGSRPGDPEPVRDRILLRSQGTFPAISRRLRLGDVDLCLFEGADVDVTPCAPASADRSWTDARGMVLGHVVSGEVQIAQDGREVVLAPGQVALYDAVTPYRIRAAWQHRYLIAHIRGRALRMRREDRDALVARDLSAFCAAAALAGLVGGLIVDDRRRPVQAAGQYLGDAIVACVHAIVAEARGTGGGPRSALLFAELVGWLETHLADPGLTTERLAAAHYLSPRYVRKLFAHHDTTVTGYLRLRRLERIRDELLQPGSADVPVSAIAARWGFAEPSVFSRAFTRQFGRGPQRFRKDAIGPE
ncbi:helix-turn-helix domain-containing protein [Cryptosporangium minutisporangium]|uniref:Helix-turn-helix domain-containing protein n=1 Tax=Cryptosporangium minutisporangium TaxID=113569 RepID=A0ABP6SS91_9ACTN